jgi:carbonic anhydrase
VHDNVALVVKQLLAAKPVLSELVATGKLRIVGAVYSLETGKVDWLSK